MIVRVAEIGYRPGDFYHAREQIEDAVRERFGQETEFLRTCIDLRDGNDFLMTRDTFDVVVIHFVPNFPTAMTAMSGKHSASSWSNRLVRSRACMVFIIYDGTHSSLNYEWLKTSRFALREECALRNGFRLQVLEENRLVATSLHTTSFM